MNERTYRILLNYNNDWVETKLTEEDIESIIGTNEQFIEVCTKSNYRFIIPISSIYLIQEIKA